MNHEITHVVFRSWCRHCVATRAKEDPHKRSDVREGAVPKVMMDWLFFTSDAEPEVMLPALLIYDLVTGATAAVQAGKVCSDALVTAVVKTFETWGLTDVVLQMDGEPSSKALAKAAASARSHRTLPRHGRRTRTRAKGRLRLRSRCFEGSSPRTSWPWRRRSAKGCPLDTSFGPGSCDTLPGWSRGTTPALTA